MCPLANTANSSKKQINISDIVGNCFLTTMMWYFGESKVFATRGPGFKYLFSNLIAVLKGASW